MLKAGGYGILEGQNVRLKKIVLRLLCNKFAFLLRSVKTGMSLR